MALDSISPGDEVTYGGSNYRIVSHISTSAGPYVIANEIGNETPTGVLLDSGTLRDNGDPYDADAQTAPAATDQAAGESPSQPADTTAAGEQPQAPQDATTQPTTTTDPTVP
jgi:hypothetical protein